MSEFKILDEVESKDAIIGFGSLVYKLQTFLKIAVETCRNNAAERINSNLSFQGKKPFVDNYEEAIKSFNEGIDAELISPNTNGWHKGKFRFRLVVEFCPDEPETLASNQPEVSPPESPLDDIRRMINQDTQS